MSYADKLRDLAGQLSGRDMLVASALLREVAGELERLEEEKARWKRLSWTWRGIAEARERRIMEDLEHEPCVPELRDSIGVD